MMIVGVIVFGCYCLLSNCIFGVFCDFFVTMFVSVGNKNLYVFFDFVFVIVIIFFFFSNIGYVFV